MPYAFNLTLDPQTSLEIERAYADFAALNIPDHDLVTQYGPCVTLLVAGDRLRPDDVAAVLALHLPAMESLAATFTEPCIIHGTPPTLSLRVSPTPPSFWPCTTRSTPSCPRTTCISTIARRIGSRT